MTLLIVIFTRPEVEEEDWEGNEPPLTTEKLKAQELPENSEAQTTWHHWPFCLKPAALCCAAPCGAFGQKPQWKDMLAGSTTMDPIKNWRPFVNAVSLKFWRIFACLSALCILNAETTRWHPTSHLPPTPEIKLTKCKCNRECWNFVISAERENWRNKNFKRLYNF